MPDTADTAVLFCSKLNITNKTVIQHLITSYSLLIKHLLEMFILQVLTNGSVGHLLTPFLISYKLFTMKKVV